MRGTYLPHLDSLVLRYINPFWGRLSIYLSPFINHDTWHDTTAALVISVPGIPFPLPFSFSLFLVLLGIGPQVNDVL